MGSFDCYCALCSGPLSLGCIQFGSNNPNTIATRKRKIENKRRRLQGEDVLDEESDEWEERERERMRTEEDEEMKSPEADDGAQGQDEAQENSDEGDDREYEDDSDSDNLSQTSELSFSSDFDFSANADEEDPFSLGGYCGLTRADVQWLDRSRVLAINPDIEGPKKAYLSGRGRYNDYFEYNIEKPGSSDRDTGASDYTIYCDFESDSGPAFPIHEACYKILTRCLSTRERGRIDKDVLNAVMLQHANNLGNNLSIDYGTFHGAEQFWASHAGEEWSVADPLPKRVEEVLESSLPPRLFGQPCAKPLHLAHQVRYDPLAMLPYNIIHVIILQLSLKDMHSLMMASSSIREASREPALWKPMCRLHITPSFWELDEFLRNISFPENFDGRGAFRWLNDMTKPSFGLSGPLMGIANRRRIWNSCLQLAPMYHEMLDTEPYIDPSDAEAASIMAAATTPQTYVTRFPALTDTRTITTQFICSWQEIESRPCELRTYWSSHQDGELIGISVDFGSEERVFGSTDGEEGYCVHISASDWIQEIRLSFLEMDMNRVYMGDPEETSNMNVSVIDGIKVTLNHGRQREYYGQDRFKHQRSVAVLPGMKMIGLTGEVDSDGSITRFGLLQAPDPSRPVTTPPSYPPAQFLRWDRKGVKLHTCGTNQSHPIWSHPTRSLFNFPPPSLPPSPTFLHPDMLSHTILEFVETVDRYETLTGISALQIPDENSTASIIGMRANHSNQLGNSGPYFGVSGPVPSQFPTQWQTAKTYGAPELSRHFKLWNEDFMHHFEIDGNAGERVVEIQVTRDHRSIKIVTNRGREGVFGELGQSKEWHVKRAEEDEVVVGLSACFGNLGGWSESVGMWSHWGLCNVGVLVARGE